MVEAMQVDVEAKEGEICWRESKQEGRGKCWRSCREGKPEQEKEKKEREEVKE